MSRMTQSYETGRLGPSCAYTGAPLKPGDRYVGALSATDQDPGMLRADYAHTAWTEGARPPRLIAFWHGVVPDKGPAKPAALDHGAMLSLMDGLAEATEPRHIAFRYVLALLLVRQRALSVAGTREASPRGPAVMLLRPRAADPADPLIEVIDPAIDDALLADIDQQMRVALGLQQ